MYIYLDAYNLDVWLFVSRSRNKVSELEKRGYRRDDASQPFSDFHEPDNGAI